MQFNIGKLPARSVPGDLYFYNSCVWIGVESGSGYLALSELLRSNPSAIAVGPQGAKGDKGDSITGAQGAQGEKGVAGKDGATGPRGERGSDGAPGAMGKTGEAGPQGAPGDSIQGPQGVQGAQGANGERGDLLFVGPEDMAAAAAVLRLERAYLRAKLAGLRAEAENLHGSDKVFALYFLEKLYAAASIKDE